MAIEDRRQNESAGLGERTVRSTHAAPSRSSVHPPADAAAIEAPAERAAEAWRQLVATSMLRRGGNQLLVMDGPGRRRASPRCGR